MKKSVLLISLLFISKLYAFSQCAMCTKTAASLDDKAAKGLNGGIIYLALMPLAFILIIGYIWYRKNKETI
ncbi:MAG: hypothetical protein R2831_13015 [Chitinophagaceae bacterium]